MSETTTLRAEIHATRKAMATFDRAIADMTKAHDEAIAKMRDATGVVHAARGDAVDLLHKLEQRLRTLVAAENEETPADDPVIDLMEQLERSVQAAKEARRAGGAA